MKYLKYFLILVIASMCLSFDVSRTSRLSESIYPGNPFPSIENLENNQGTKINLSDLKGQKVLVVFWAAYNAESRKDNLLFSNVIKKNNHAVKQVSLSLDKSKAVYDKTLSLDGLDSEYQFLITENHQNLLETYQLENGFRSFLLDEAGNILATDLEVDDLEQYMTET